MKAGKNCYAFLPAHHRFPATMEFDYSILIEALLDMYGLLHQQFLSPAIVQH